MILSVVRVRSWQEMSENDDADRGNDDGQSTHPMTRDVTMASRDVNEQHDSERYHQPSASATTSRCSSGVGELLLKGRRWSLQPTDGSSLDPSAIQNSLSSHDKRPSLDGVVQTEEPPSTGARGGDGSRVSLLPHRSTIHGYGTLHPPMHHQWADHHHRHKPRVAVSRLSFTEVVERITLTWENIDVYAPPAGSGSIVLRGLSASSANSELKSRHILKNGNLGHRTYSTV